MVSALLLMAATLGTLTSAPASAQTEARGLTAAIYQSEAFAATNVERVTRDRVPLGHQPCVQRFAERQAQRMADRQEMFHQDLGRVLRRCGLSMAGENVAYGYVDGGSVVHDGWMKSPDHRANILRRGYRLMGMGARKSAGVWYVSQVFGRRA